MAEITIGMPVFNDVDFIEESLISILDQSFTNFKLIISDDGSTDGSQTICEKYAAIDHRIEYIRQPKNLGISRNMEFLLSQANTPYFMWAADDDLWDKMFVEKLVKLLNNNKEAVSAFCISCSINDNNVKITQDKLFNYSSNNTIERLKKFITTPNDNFGYGIFRTHKIKEVKFPVWWWPNKRCAYNNIFPTLCFYLSKGDIVYDESVVLFFKRMKKEELINHKLPYKENSLRETIAYGIRKFNLVCASFSMIKKGHSLKTGLSVLPLILSRWFIKPTYFKFKHFLKITLKIKKIISHRKTDYLY